MHMLNHSLATLKLYYIAFVFTLQLGWPFKIKGLLTYVFDVTIVMMRNMRAQLLMFQNGIYSQDLYYRVITRFHRIITASGMIMRLL